MRLSRRTFLLGTTCMGTGLLIDQYDHVIQFIQRFGISVISAGKDFSIAVRDGRVYAWGSNDYGECDVPRGLPRIAHVSAGVGRTLALSEDGDVFVWGGRGDMISVALVKVPRDLPPITSVLVFGMMANLFLADDKQTIHVVRMIQAEKSVTEIVKMPTQIQHIYTIGAIIAVIGEDGSAYMLSFHNEAALTVYTVPFQKPVLRFILINDCLIGVTTQGTVIPADGVAIQSTIQPFAQDILVAVEKNYALSQMHAVRDIVPAPVIDLRTEGFYTVDKQGSVDFVSNQTIQSTQLQRFQPPFSRNTAIRIMSSSETHVLALTTAGEVLAWGNNDYGQCDIPLSLLD